MALLYKAAAAVAFRMFVYRFLPLSMLVLRMGALRHRESSRMLPMPVPGGWVKYSMAAGLAQQTYCRENWIGMRVGDATLLWQYGDGAHRQRVMLFDSASLGLAVAFMGTNLSSMHSMMHDLVALPVVPNVRYRCMLPPSARVFAGFQGAYVPLADAVKHEVLYQAERLNRERVTVIGHSLGAAMALLAALHLHSVVGVSEVITFGLPRTGNRAFASAIDSVFGDRFHFVVNGKDPVPHLAPRFLGYQHPSNLIWINPGNSDQWMLYPGQENVHAMQRALPVLSSHHHNGVYFHTRIGASDGYCPARVATE